MNSFDYKDSASSSISVKKPRITYIDVLKIIGIIALLFEHTGNWTELGGIYKPIKVYICSFHMPLFFIAYGMVASFQHFNLIDWKSFLTKRFKSLMVPYILWSMIYSVAFGLPFFLGIVYGSHTSIGAGGTNQVLWFLPAFFIATIFFQICKECICILNKKQINTFVITIIIILILVGISYTLDLHIPEYGYFMSLNVAFMGCAFMIVGTFVRRLLDWVFSQKVIFQVLVFLIGIIFGATIAFANVSPNSWVCIMALSFYGKSYLAFILSATFSTISLGCLAYFLKGIKLLQWLGENSLLILCMHYIVFSYTVNFAADHFSNIYLTAFGLHNLSNVIIPVVNTLLTLLFCVPFIWFINRFIQSLSGK